MAEILDYQRRHPRGPVDRRLGRMAAVLAASAAACLLLPFGVLIAVGAVYAGSENPMMGVVIPLMLLLWLASGLLALTGTVASIIALRRGDVRALTIAAMVVHALVLLVCLASVASGIISTIRNG